MRHQITSKSRPAIRSILYSLLVLSLFCTFSIPAFAQEKSGTDLTGTVLCDNQLSITYYTDTESVVRENRESGYILYTYNSEENSLIITEYDNDDNVLSNSLYSSDELASMANETNYISRASYTSHSSCYTKSNRNYDIYTYPTYVLWDAYKASSEKHYIQNNNNITKLFDHKSKVDSLSSAETSLIAYAGISVANIGFGAAISGGPGAALAALTQLVGGVAPVYAYTNALDAADNSFNSL